MRLGYVNEFSVTLEGEAIFSDNAKSRAELQHSGHFPACGCNPD